MIRRYVIERDPEDGRVRAWHHLSGDQPRALFHWRVHSPSGFEVGYGGSGPADLALAILATLFSCRRDFTFREPREKWSDAEKNAWEHHQDFKSEFLADPAFRNQSRIEIEEDDVRRWLVSRGALNESVQRRRGPGWKRFGGRRAR